MTDIKISENTDATPATASSVARPAPVVPAPQPATVATTANYETSLKNAILSGNIPQIVMFAISHALNTRTSDIHIEPEGKTVRLRYRVDGVLLHIIEYPLNIHPAVVSRIKIMSGLKIDEQRIPQDGRTQVTTDQHRNIDLRVSSLPTVNGEKIVMRLQDKTEKIQDLPELGMSKSALKIMERFIKTPNGVLLISGPTGSGKTNTLYSALARLNQVEVNIVTFEDPVEYQMDGLNQSQVKPDIDYTFATGLRTALRQDPDIVMVGEIRDQETIEIAIRAALTGHLVLSTIHTNSAVATLVRVLDMGVKPFLITSSIRGVIAQRLVRRVCKNCKEAYIPPAEVAEEIKKEMEGVSPEDLEGIDLNSIQLYKGKGCDKCNQSGYSGRVGIFEIMEMSREIGQLVLKNAPDSQLTDAAKAGGMATLIQDGYLKALKGETTLGEVYRVAQLT